ncbi:hypothetical protein O181_070223 [Austropuccinia psidii MF-1]|uniref:Integrase catalytic domain-containing protein n=1 Tax=Austropuccinia psidii MF-1 TaxID=1389203 RepID=A0A9Q3EYP7_9BASI|nr:hypothetical protein [Austropuccinia psidii MF-1]
MQSELKLMSYIHKIQNKIQRCPSFLHTDRGGEFYSTSFRSKAKALGIVFERGPANSPQTNSIAERFNQTLLTKCRCLLAQSNVPIRFWDEAIKSSSTLINLLPSRSLNWKSPVSVLLELKSNIEPVRSLNSLIPFGLKAFVSRQPESKVLPPSKPLLYLGPEDSSYASRFLDPQTGKFIVSGDYTPVPFKFNYTTSGSLKKSVEGLPCTTTNNSSLAQHSQITIIPSWPCKNNISSTTPTIPDDRSPPAPTPFSEPTITVKSETIRPLLNHAPLSAHHPVSHFLIKRVMLTFHTITIPQKTSTETTLLPNLEDKGTYPRLQGHRRHVATRPKEEQIGKILKYKARWVCFGNHQENMVNYYNTYAAVDRSESFKILLLLMVNRKYLAYQFDVETAFLYGEMDAPNYVSQVANYEVPASADTDKCLFFNTDRTIFLHIHVDDGFIIGETAENRSVILHQQDFCSKILEEFKMTSANSIKTPAPANNHNVIAQASVPFSNLTMQKAIRMLNYLALHTRPDIMFTTNLLSQFTN